MRITTLLAVCLVSALLAGCKSGGAIYCVSGTLHWGKSKPGTSKYLGRLGVLLDHENCPDCFRNLERFLQTQACIDSIRITALVDAGRQAKDYAETRQYVQSLLPSVEWVSLDPRNCEGRYPPSNAGGIHIPWDLEYLPALTVNRGSAVHSFDYSDIFVSSRGGNKEPGQLTEAGKRAIADALSCD